MLLQRPLCLKNEILNVGRFALIKQNFLKRSSEIPFRISDDLGFGFQVQHQSTGGWNRFKNKTLGVS